MIQEKKKRWLEAVKAGNVLLMTLLIRDVWYLYYANILISPFYRRGNWLIILIYAILYVGFGRIYDAFSVSRNRIPEMVYNQSLAALVADFFLYLIIMLLAKRLTNPLPLLAGFAGQVLVALLWSLLFQNWYYRSFPRKRTAVIFDLRPEMADQIQNSWMGKKYEIILNLSVEECLADPECLSSVETVLLSGVHSHDRNVILKFCIARGLEVFVIPRIGDVIMGGSHRVEMLHLPMLSVTRYNPPTYYLFIKRLSDILLSFTALVILSPLFLITAAAIKLGDGGPVFYRQTRLTKDGREFAIIKFRSMRPDAEQDGVARLSAGENDDRITPVGRIIRKVRLDELPQLLNILTGDMTICGPRPERPEIAARYEEVFPEFRLRLQAKAGLTGLAQVYGKYNSTPYDKLLLDLMYIAHPSLLEDLRIIFGTVKILFMAESTEGIEADEITALHSTRV